MSGMKARVRHAVILILIATMAAPAWSLTDEEVFRNFRFNLTNPGARSLALGGAFLSIADDATAALANPAGLSYFTRWEVFFEVRALDSGGQAFVAEGQDLIAVGSSVSDQVIPGFLSGVFKAGPLWVGLSRHELLNFQNDTLSRYVLAFDSTPGAVIYEGVGAIDVQTVNWNASAGYRITDYLSIGGTITYSTLDVQSDVVNMITNTGDPNLLEPTLDLHTEIDDTDSDWIGSLGLIYKKPSKWGAGAVYRRGPDFSVEQRITPLIGEGGEVIQGLDLDGVAEEVGQTFQNRFNLPDTVGIGGHWFPTEQLLLSLNVDRIFYSDLTDDYIAGLNVLTGFDAEFTIDDATDYRLGAEYLFYNTKNKLPPLGLRGGLFLESETTIRAVDPGTDTLAVDETGVFQGVGDVLHGSIGVGFSFSHVQLDLAADFSEVDNEYVVSFIYRGGKKK